eukprot:364761-Chlamydomonas_euryale.AAC.6
MGRTKAPSSAQKSGLQRRGLPRAPPRNPNRRDRGCPCRRLLGCPRSRVAPNRVTLLVCVGAQGQWQTLPNLLADTAQRGMLAHNACVSGRGGGQRYRQTAHTHMGYVRV